MHNHNHTSHKKRGLFFLLFPLMFFGLGAIVMLLWNALLPQLVGANPVNYWQALGLLLLSRILFGGFRFGPRGNGFGQNGARFGNPSHMRQRWMNMSDEERERFKEMWRKRCHDKQPPRPKEYPPEN